jgi:hypothetical protein
VSPGKDCDRCVDAICMLVSVETAGELGRWLTSTVSTAVISGRVDSPLFSGLSLVHVLREPGTAQFPYGRLRTSLPRSPTMNGWLD